MVSICCLPGSSIFLLMIELLLYFSVDLLIAFNLLLKSLFYLYILQNTLESGLF